MLDNRPQSYNIAALQNSRFFMKISLDFTRLGASPVVQAMVNVDSYSGGKEAVLIDMEAGE